MASKNSNSLPSSPEIGGPDYRGPDRRDPNANEDTVELVGSVSFDVKGDPVWQTQVRTPRHREDDDTIDTLKHLDQDSLSLQSTDSSQEKESIKMGGGCMFSATAALGFEAYSIANDKYLEDTIEESLSCKEAYELSRQISKSSAHNSVMVDISVRVMIFNGIQ
jgi:hypothetical protein